MTPKIPTKKKRLTSGIWIYAVFVFVTSFFTYMYRYDYPPHPFWDEPYHIASAEKYLNGVYFMEQHPPLGKLLIALGEKIVHPNEKTDQFINTDYAGNIPDGFSFAGFRLFPTMMAWFTALTLFFIFVFITGSGPLSALLSFLFVFDNAEIVHSRGAMIDSPLTFFGMLCVLLFLHLQRKDRKYSQGVFLMLAALLGIAFACTVTTKIVGLVFLLLFPLIIWQLLNTRREREIVFGTGAILLCGLPLALLCIQRILMWLYGKADFFAKLSILFHDEVFLFATATIIILATCISLWRSLPASRIVMKFLLASFIPFFITYAAVWEIHFSLGKKIVPELSNSGYYQASEEQKVILAAGQQSSLQNFRMMLADSFTFVRVYNNGVPRLDLCKADENGSPPFFWPFGARSINFRWEQAGEGIYRYLYLQSNPVSWGLGLLGMIAAVILLSGPLLFSVKEKLKHPFLLVSFLSLYMGYMIAISRIPRVMYLYHYFLPLLFSFILFGLVLVNLQKIGGWILNNDRKIILMTVLGFLIFAAYQFFRPLSYYEPIKDEAFKKRSILPLWELTCVRCQKTSQLVVPLQK